MASVYRLLMVDGHTLVRLLFLLLSSPDGLCISVLAGFITFFVLITTATGQITSAFFGNY